jgi:hypothetical protein
MSQEALKALGATWPAVAVAALCMIIAWRPWRCNDGLWGGSWGSVAALGLGFIASFVAMNGWPGYPTPQRWQRLVFIGAAATAAGLVAALMQPRGAWRIGLGLAACASAARLIDPPPAFANTGIWKAALGIGSGVLWLGLEPLAERRRGASMPLAMCTVFGGVSVILLESRLANFSLLAAAVSSAAGMAMVVAWLNPRVSLAHGAVHVGVALLASLVLTSWFYRDAGVGSASFILVAAAPLALWIGEAPLIARWRPWKTTVLRAAAVGLLVAIGVALAIRPETNPMEY